MDYVWATSLALGCLASWVLNVVGLPGNWVTVALCATYAALGPNQGRWDIGWGVVICLLALGLLGEIIEMLASAWSTNRAGGSKRGALLALAGSILGGGVGMFVGIPVPVIGPLIGAVLCASVGALAGAWAGERWKGRDMHESLRIGNAAFWGRLFGTLGKSLVGAVMVVLVFAALVV